jgi:hypothetical protein
MDATAAQIFARLNAGFDAAAAHLPRVIIAAEHATHFERALTLRGYAWEQAEWGDEVTFFFRPNMAPDIRRFARLFSSARVEAPA